MLAGGVCSVRSKRAKSRPNATGCSLTLRRLGGMCLPALLLIVPVSAQIPKPTAAAGQVESPKDLLGRTTPRGTVLGFLNAAHKGDGPRAAQYLNTRARGEAASTLANRL